MAGTEDRPGKPSEERDPRDFRDPELAIELVLRAYPRKSRTQAKSWLIARYTDGSGSIWVWTSELRHGGPSAEVLRHEMYQLGEPEIEWAKTRWNIRDVERELRRAVVEPDTFASLEAAAETVEAKSRISPRLLPLAEKGLQLVANGRALSDRDAALMLVDEAKAAGAARQDSDPANVQSRIDKAMKALRKTRELG